MVKRDSYVGTSFKFVAVPHAFAYLRFLPLLLLLLLAQPLGCLDASRECWKIQMRYVGHPHQ